MIEKYGFFDSLMDDVREYSEEDFARFGRVLAIDGVRGGEDALKVSAYAAGLAVKVEPGMAMVRGRHYALEDDGSGERVITLTTAASNPRIDRIVLRLSHGSRTIAVGVLQGTEAAQPTPPNLQRDADVYMLSLAQIHVGVGVAAITDASIVDERRDEDVCGIMIASSDAAMAKAGEAAKAAETARKTASDAGTAAEAAQKKADEVADAINAMKKVNAGGVSGNLLMFDDNGNAKDSGYTAARLGTGVKYSLSGSTLTITTL